MKQILTVFFCLLASITGYAENKIKMVTYFPVPYVAYSKVNVTDQLDIGLTTSCIMNLGCTESGNAGLRPLNVTNGVVQKGRLDLNTATAVSGSTVSIGSGSGSGSMNFNSNLRVNTLNDGVSVEANNITIDTLKLFPNRITTDFPSCASTGAPGTPNISWQKLKLKDKEEVYLMCGNPQKVQEDCSVSSYKQSHKSECCPGVSVRDSICYKDCPGESTFSWGYSGNTVEGWLGSDWKVKSCSRKGPNNSSYTSCSGTVGHYAYDREYPCWIGPSVAESRGIQVVGYSHGSSGPEDCSQASNGSCAAEWDVGKTCVVFEWNSRIECDWRGSWSDEPTIAKFEGTCQVWRCNKQQGHSYRCKNGW